MDYGQLHVFQSVWMSLWFRGLPAERQHPAEVAEAEGIWCGKGRPSSSRPKLCPLLIPIPSHKKTASSRGSQGSGGLWGARGSRQRLHYTLPPQYFPQLCLRPWAFCVTRVGSSFSSFGQLCSFESPSVGVVLLRRGVPIREQLVRWFRELQVPCRVLDPRVRTWRNVLDPLIHGTRRVPCAEPASSTGMDARPDPVQCTVCARGANSECLMMQGT